MQPRSRKIFLISAGAIATLVVLAVSSVWVLFIIPTRSTYHRLSNALAEDVDDFHAQRWTRPVLRGEAVEGNAFDAQLETVLTGLPEEAMGQAGEQLRAGAAIDAALRALISERQPELMTYREATQRAYSWGDYPVEDGLSADEIEYLPHLRSTRLLLLAAREASPGQCVPMALDAIRLGQDRAAGRSLVGLMIHAVSVEDAFIVLTHCLRRADDATLEQASRELAILAAHPAPTGYTFEIESIGAGAMFREMLEPLEGLPVDGPSIEVWTQAGQTLDAWEQLAEDPSERRRIGEHYPDDIADLAAWQSSLTTSGNPLLALATPDFARYVRRDAASRTRVRLLLAMTRLMRGEPRSILEEEALYDSLTGRPLETREVDGVIELRSAGEDETYGPNAEDVTDDVIGRVIREESPPSPPE